MDKSEPIIESETEPLSDLEETAGDPRTETAVDPLVDPKRGMDTLINPGIVVDPINDTTPCDDFKAAADPRTNLEAAGDSFTEPLVGSENMGTEPLVCSDACVVVNAALASEARTGKDANFSSRLRPPGSQIRPPGSHSRRPCSAPSGPPGTCMGPTGRTDVLMRRSQVVRHGNPSGCVAASAAIDAAVRYMLISPSCRDSRTNSSP